MKGQNEKRKKFDEAITRAEKEGNHSLVRALLRKRIIAAPYYLPIMRTHKGFPKSF